FAGTIVGGSTRAGVSELVGGISEGTKRPGLMSVGYHPELMRAGTSLDRRYTHLVSTDGHDFSPLEPLQMWTDLLAAGVQPASVRLIGIGGGRIAGIEYQLALALGAQVGVFPESGRAAGEMLSDSFW